MVGILSEVNQQLQSSLDKGIAVSQQEKGLVVQQESGCQGGQRGTIMRALSLNPFPPKTKQTNNTNNKTVITLPISTKRGNQLFPANPPRHP